MVGNATLDHVFVVADLLPGEKRTALSYEATAGGQAANAASTLAGLGCRVRFLGAFGGDAAGALSRQSFLTADCTVDRPVLEHVPGHTAVVLDASTGDRTIIDHRDPRLIEQTPVLPSDWFAGSPVCSLMVTRHSSASTRPRRAGLSAGAWSSTWRPSTTTPRCY